MIVSRVIGGWQYASLLQHHCSGCFELKLFCYRLALRSAFLESSYAMSETRYCGMTEITRSLNRTPEQVWDRLMNPGLWGIPGELKLVPAGEFVIKHYPLLGTIYTGEWRCEILSVLPERLLEFSMEPIGDGARPTRWVMRFEISAYLDGSCVVISIFGVDSTRRSERILLHVARGFIEARLSKLGGDAKYGNRIRRASGVWRPGHRVGPGWAERVWCSL